MLEAMIKKSSRDPRPANPLGRKAPFATFIDLCHRHQFESEILPEAERKGWPKAIDWDGLSARIEQMQSELQKLIDDTSDNIPHIKRLAQVGTDNSVQLMGWVQGVFGYHGRLY